MKGNFHARFLGGCGRANRLHLPGHCRMSHKRSIVALVAALVLAALAVSVTALRHPACGVSVSFMCCTNDVSAVRIVAAPVFSVSPEVAATCPDTADLAALVTNQPAYQRFARTFNADGQTRFAVFRLHNQSSHRVLCRPSRMTAWPDEGLSRCQTSLSALASLLRPAEDVLAAVPVPAGGHRWHCEFEICRMLEEPALLGSVDRHISSFPWLHQALARLIARNAASQMRPRVLMGPEMHI